MQEKEREALAKVGGTVHKLCGWLREACCSGESMD